MNEQEQFKYDKRVWIDLLLDEAYEWPDTDTIETIMRFASGSGAEPIVLTEAEFLRLYAFTGWLGF